MIPPLVRRCPECGKIGLVRSFAAVDGDSEGDRRTESDADRPTGIHGGNRVECPRCGHRFRTLANPVLN
ncbi:hypothetical protein [Halosimplex sp. J119]